MTIHKSKGLEFPVVFVSGLGRKMNQMDASDRLVVHPDLGLGICEISGQSMPYIVIFMLFVLILLPVYSLLH